MKAAMVAMKEAGGQLPSSEVVVQVEQRVTLDDYAKATLGSGGIRWKAIFHWFSVGFCKAGLLVKEKGIWYLTPQGEVAMGLPDLVLLHQVDEGYAKWKKTRPTKDEPEEIEIETMPQADLVLEDMESKATEGFKAFLDNMNEWDFQKLVAALLRGMGYHTPFVAPSNKPDGGVDVIAYKDPIGATLPRIKVQCKHRETKATAQELRALKGVLHESSEVGVFVSTEGFTADAMVETRGSQKHIELIDGKRLITLWQQFYEKLNEEDRALMPMRPVFFLDLPKV